MRDYLARFKKKNAALLYLVLGSATILLLFASVLGAIVNRPTGQRVGTAGGLIGLGPDGGEQVAAGQEAASPDDQAGDQTGATAKRRARGVGGVIDALDLKSEAGATRVGVTPTEIRWGLHAPETFDGQPLNLAEDPLLGVDVFLAEINQTGIGGRKIVKYFGDDRYTVEGAKSASNYIFNDSKVFFASGTLGVDQVAVVAQAARNTKPTATPYMAAGGSEADFKSIGMFQIAGSYDTHLIKLAEFLNKEVTKGLCTTSCGPNQSIYGGMKRVAAVELDSKYIRGSVASLEAAVKAAPNLEWAGTVLVPKFTDSSNTHNYAGQILELQSKTAQIVVPATDPLTTANMVAQCGGCTYKWTMSNFAHDSDTALKLMAGTWTGVRGLSGGCYYQLWNSTTTAKCGNLKAAHDGWVAARGEDDWNTNGQGGVAGYQITHFWLRALKNIADDPTRERLNAALLAYNGYDDLVSSPITFLGSSNISHGIDKFAVYEATPQQRWTQLSDGVVGSF